MNEYVLAVLIGIVEGLTEFLPVSSTAHIRITQALLGQDLTDGFWKLFAIAIQLGAILSLPIYFRTTLRMYIRHFPEGPRGGKTVWTHPLSLVMLAFVCTAGPAFALTKIIGKNLESLTIMGWALLVGGAVMWAIDYLCSTTTWSRTHRLDEMNQVQAVWIGVCQAIAALFPGTSRSMATIASGQLAGLSRAVALEFSFLVSIPTMCMAVAYDVYKAVRGKDGNAIGPDMLTSHHITLLLIGGAVSFVVAYAVVRWFMGYVRGRGFVPFAIYRIIVGTWLLWYAGGK